MEIILILQNTGTSLENLKIDVKDWPTREMRLRVRLVFLRHKKAILKKYVIWTQFINIYSSNNDPQGNMEYK